MNNFRYVIFLIVGSVLGCMPVSENQKKREGIDFKIINPDLQSFQAINKHFRYYGKKELKELLDTSSNFIIVNVANNSPDTVYIFLTKHRYSSTHYFFKNIDGSRKSLGYKGGSDWGMELIRIPPDNAESFLESYDNPAEINADEIDFEFEYYVGSGLEKRKSKFAKINLQLTTRKY